MAYTTGYSSCTLGEKGFRLNIYGSQRCNAITYWTGEWKWERCNIFLKYGTKFHVFCLLYLMILIKYITMMMTCPHVIGGERAF